MTLGEKLGRYGGAIMNAGRHGGMAQIGAMGNTTGAIAGAEREMERYAYEQAAARQKEEQVRQAKQQQAYQKATEERQAEVATLDNLDARFSMALANFELYDNVTGVTPGDAWARATDWAGWNDSSRQAFRYEIKQIIVDQTLMSTAKTKGAISDKEMALFKSGIPTMNDDEETWKAWLNERRSWIAFVRNRMVQGIKVDAGADIGFPGYTPPAATQQQQSFTQDDDDALFNIPTKK